MKGRRQFDAWRLFGVFCPIQCSILEKPEILVAMESEDFGGVMWGDCGNGQVFYEFDESEHPVFTHDWSCT